MSAQNSPLLPSNSADLEKAALQAANFEAQASPYASTATNVRPHRPNDEESIASSLLRVTAIFMGALASFTLGQALLTIWTQCEGFYGIWEGLMGLTGTVTITFNDNAAFQLAFMLLTLLVSTFVVVTWTVASLFLGGFLA